MTSPMSDPKNSQGNILRRSLLRAKLVWRLFLDRRVSLLWKIIPVAGILYVFFPLDIIFDLIPLAGQADDVGIFLGSLWLFVEMCPADIVREHWDALTGVLPGAWEEGEQKQLPGGKKD
jgi:uncharacterized membrane protein YkvA (DUF1232 family)